MHVPSDYVIKVDYDMLESSEENGLNCIALL